MIYYFLDQKNKYHPHSVNDFVKQDADKLQFFSDGLFYFNPMFHGNLSYATGLFIHNIGTNLDLFDIKLESEVGKYLQEEQVSLNAELEPIFGDDTCKRLVVHLTKLPMSVAGKNPLAHAEVFNYNNDMVHYCTLRFYNKRLKQHEKIEYKPRLVDLL